MESENVNRGSGQLQVWNNAIELHIPTCEIFSGNPFELKKTISNCIDVPHGISRNIEEGYPGIDIREYLNFLNFALGSGGGYHSGICSFHKAA